MGTNNLGSYLMVYKNTDKNIHEVAVFSQEELEEWVEKSHITTTDDFTNPHATRKEITLYINDFTKKSIEDLKEKFETKLEALKRKYMKDGVGTILKVSNDTRIKHEGCLTNNDLLAKGIVKAFFIPDSVKIDYSALITTPQTTIFTAYPEDDYEDETVKPGDTTVTQDDILFDGIEDSE